MEELILKELREMKQEIGGIKQKIDEVETNLNKRIDEVETNLNKRIDEVETNLNKRIDKVEKEIIDEYRSFTMVVYKKQEESNDRIDKNHNEFKRYKGSIRQFMNSFEKVVV